ncbi:MAG: hypothetical protein SH856_04245 [Flavobacteriales bacterium]|nr:hypothetical protein [Flavobacteriales bacterium]
MIKASAKSLKEFYGNLGYLFYSIAAVDNNITREEEDQIHKEVKERWLGLENSHDNFGTDAAFEIEFVFDWIRDNAMSAKLAFKNFESFYHGNPNLFDEETIGLIYKSATHIAEAFHGSNKKESEVMIKLHALLGKAQVA